MKKIENLIDFFNLRKNYEQEDYINLICQFGMINDTNIPDLYGNYQDFMLPDRADLGIYQNPLQFAQFLVWLQGMIEAEFYDCIGSYCQVGVFRGGSFLFMKFFLMTFDFHFFTCIDPSDNIHPGAKKYIEPYLIKDATSMNIEKHKYDIVFIDGDHSYEWVKSDYENIGKYARLCIFHDICEPTCPDVVQFWNEIKGGNFVEFLGPHHGIGVKINV